MIIVSRHIPGKTCTTGKFLFRMNIHKFKFFEKKSKRVHGIENLRFHMNEKYCYFGLR